MEITQFITPILLAATVQISAASPASVTLANPSFGEYNTLTMELGGTTQGSEYDHLNVTGTAALDGVLDVVLVDGFIPDFGDSFDILDGNTTGSFAATNLPPLLSGLAWDTSQLASQGVLSVTLAAELTAIQAWRHTHFGSPVDYGNGANTFDFDNDGHVNLIEFAFGLNPTSGSSNQLPQAQHSGGNFFFDFIPPAGVSGITYGAEWSTTLQSDDWNPIPDTGTPPQHLFSVPTDSKDRLFLRFQITDP